jgi:hypothetical protein
MNEQILPPAILAAKRALDPTVFATVINGDRLCPKAYKALSQDDRLHVRDLRAYAAEQKSADWLPQIAADMGGKLVKYEARTLKNGTKRITTVTDIVPPKPIKRVGPLAAARAEIAALREVVAKAGLSIDV